MDLRCPDKLSNGKCETMARHANHQERLHNDIGSQILLLLFAAVLQSAGPMNVGPVIKKQCCEDLDLPITTECT